RHSIISQHLGVNDLHLSSWSPFTTIKGQMATMPNYLGDYADLLLSQKGQYYFPYSADISIS
ncbi:MAG TPA: hypothetical protein PLQ69_06305, partial [Paludibacter sp.]|nr:hypothetical protein [Paludibacter sp.]